MIFPGCSFEVQRKGPKNRTNAAKIRLVIDSVEPSMDSSGPLYFELTKSRVSLKNGPVVETKSPVPEEPEEPPPQQAFQLNTDGIGGLSNQIETINDCLASLTEDTFALDDYHLIGPNTLLLHGPEGTGKSLLLERLSQCPWREVANLNMEWLASNSKTVSKALSDIFETARNSQPSLIVIDDLEKFLAKNETLPMRLKEELKKLEATRVLVASATRSVYDIDVSLRTPSAFKLELEIFSPNIKQREDMLRQILGPDRAISDVDYTALAERTHGFVGRDIHKLCSLARNYRVQLIYRSLEPDKRPSFRDYLGRVDFVAQEDFDAVIDQVRPTVLKDSVLEVPKVRWTDIAGVDHVRKLLESITVRPFKVRTPSTLFTVYIDKTSIPISTPSLADPNLGKASSYMVPLDVLRL